MCLDTLWTKVGWDSPSSIWMDGKLRDELLCCLVVAPLCRSELRLPFSSEVTVPDASEKGGSHSVSI
eukprot:8844122-Karenia_brevis.AAC.1